VIKGASGGYRGVAIDLGSALAQKLGVPVEFVPYLASGAITADAKSDVWDVTFMPVDEERKKAVAFGSAYHLLAEHLSGRARLRNQNARRRKCGRCAHRRRRRHGNLPRLQQGLAKSDPCRGRRRRRRKSS